MKKTMVILVVMLVALAGCKKTDKTTTVEETATPKEKVIGVYDSRAVAMSYWEQEVDGKARMRRNEDLGITPQELGLLMHQQVFSHHKPTQALEWVKDKLPEFMKQNKVDVVVSKWDKEELAQFNVVGSGWDDDFKTNNPNVIDVTLKIAQVINPTVTQQMCDDFGRSKPAPLDTDWANVKE